MRTRKVLAGLAAAGLTVVGLALTVPSAQASGVKLSQSEAASRLRAADITWISSGGCTDRGNSHCTSLSQINSGTVKDLITFHKQSNCKVVITGGTETGHAPGTYSHWNGYKVDIAKRACVDNYITRHFTSIGGNKWRSSSGNVYFNEGDHWDITYY